MINRVVFCFKQKTADEMRISDWSSDVCSSDLLPAGAGRAFRSRMATLVPELRESLTRAFGADDYQAHIRSEGARVQNPLRDEMEALRTEARERGLDIVQTQQGPAVDRKSTL